MLEHATLITPEQVIAFMGVVGALVVTNIGQLLSWALRAYRRKIKGDLDLNAAFKRIRDLEQKLNELKEEKKQ